MMLASESHFWPLEGDELGGSFPEMKPFMGEPYASLVKRLLPDHTLSDDAISTKEKRMNLATDLEFALGQASSSNKQPATLPDLRTEQPAANAPPSSNVVSKQPTMPASSKPKAREAKLIPARDEQPAATPWLVWTVMIVAAIGLLWLVLRNRK